MANMFFFNYLINYSDWCNLHEYCKESSGSENLVKTFLERSISYIGSLLETANLALITFFFPVRNINFDFFPVQLEPVPRCFQIPFRKSNLPKNLSADLIGRYVLSLCWRMECASVKNFFQTKHSGALEYFPKNDRSEIGVCRWPPLVASLVIWGVSDLETIKMVMVTGWVANLNAPGKLH